jgi:hypothetical protein
MALQFVIALHAMAPGYKRRAPTPQISTTTMLAHNLLGWLGYAAPVALWDAWAQPSWSYSAPGLLATSYW